MKKEHIEYRGVMFLSQLFNKNKSNFAREKNVCKGITTYTIAFVIFKTNP